VKFFLIINGKKLKQWIILTTAALFAIGITYAQRNNITVFSASAPLPQAIYKVNTKEKKLALTFDISWGKEKPEMILDVLQEKGVKKATFFLSGEWSENHPDIVKRIQTMGYEIGSHGYEHKKYTRLTDDEIRKQIRKAQNAIASITGVKPTLLRPPDGDVDARVLAIAYELGYKVILWDTDANDWTNPGVEQIIKNVIDHAHPGDIVFLHASDSTKQTHLALPAIIDKLRDQGYQFMTVSELINDAQVKTKEAD
jgi:polysaccharide deacetylase family sporulation protein PdaB